MLHQTGCDALFCNRVYIQYLYDIPHRLKCQEIIQSDQLNSHARHEIFGHVVKTPNGITFISYNESLCENGMRKMKYKYIKTPLIV